MHQRVKPELIIVNVIGDPKTLFLAVFFQKHLPNLNVGSISVPQFCSHCLYGNTYCCPVKIGMDKTCYAGGIPTLSSIMPWASLPEVNCGRKSIAILRCKVDVKSGVSYGYSRVNPGIIQ